MLKVFKLNYLILKIIINFYHNYIVEKLLLSF